MISTYGIGTDRPRVFVEGAVYLAVHRALARNWRGWPDIYSNERMTVKSPLESVAAILGLPELLI